MIHDDFDIAFALFVVSFAIACLVLGCAPVWECTGRRADGQCNAWRKA